MKLAIVTEDKATISEHLGGAPYFVVVTVEGGKVVSKETRGKMSHKEFADGETHPPIDEKGRHGYGPTASERHRRIFDVIKDCDVLIAGRMGSGAYDDMKSLGLEVICTDVKDIDEAVSLYIAGKLTHREDRLC